VVSVGSRSGFVGPVAERYAGCIFSHAAPFFAMPIE
jgi:hypothetical protein